MKSWFIKILFLTSVIYFSYSCSKEVVASFTVPSTYRYNSPNLDKKYVFAIDTLSKNFKFITDTLGSFNRGNNEIADSLNRIIQHEFLSSMLLSITFISSDQASLTFAQLDTTGVFDTFINKQEVPTGYSFLGNQIILKDFPQYYININNSFLELNFCQEFSLRSERVSPGVSQKKYYKNLCRNDLPEEVIRQIISTNAATRYDTISLEYVNYIFSKY